MQNGNDGRCPDGQPTYPTPNGSNSASRSGQNGGSNQSRTRLVTELLRCDGFATPEGNPAKIGGIIRLRLIDHYLSARRRSNAPGRCRPWRQVTQRQILPTYSLALIELSSVFRHLEAADEVGIARQSSPLRTDAIGLFRRQKCRPFVDEFGAWPVRFGRILRKQGPVRLFRTDLAPAARCHDIPGRRSNPGWLALAPAERRSERPQLPLRQKR